MKGLKTKQQKPPVQSLNQEKAKEGIKQTSAMIVEKCSFYKTLKNQSAAAAFGFIRVTVINDKYILQHPQQAPQSNQTPVCKIMMHEAP